jgi:hypothetical protein
MSIWVGLVVIIGAALLLELLFELRNLARHQEGVVLGFYKETVAHQQDSAGGSAQTWWRSPAGFFSLLAVVVSVFLTPATFLLALSHNSDDIPWGIFGLCALGVLYLLTGLWASGAAGTIKAGLIAGTILAGVTGALIVVATVFGGHTWSVGPWSSEDPSLIGYLAYYVALTVFFGLPGLALCAGGAVLGTLRQRRMVARVARVRRGQRSRR